MSTKIENLLGDSAKLLLDHKCKTVSSEKLHLPGPDFVDRIYSLTDLVKRRAAIAGKSAEVTARLCEGAFEALMSGDTAKHDSMVAAALKELSTTVDVIVLAQASMARVVDGLAAADKRIPILASPPIAIDHLAAILI